VCCVARLTLGWQEAIQIDHVPPVAAVQHAAEV